MGARETDAVLIKRLRQEIELLRKRLDERRDLPHFRPIPSHIFQNHPRPLHDAAPRPEAVATYALHELCALAKIPCRVTGSWTVIYLIRGNKNFYRNDARWVSVGREWKPTRIAALRLLETLAYGFFDYGARECLRPIHEQLFGPPEPIGRPRTRAAP